MLINNAETLRTYFPNSVLEIDDEISFFTKVEPYLQATERWLRNFVLGDAEDYNSIVTSLSCRVVVDFALSEAIPTLDLVLTPNGFGVVSTDAMAPASKERVERLISSLSSSAENNLIVLVDELLKVDSWLSTAQGQYFTSTFLYRLGNVSRWNLGSDIMETYERIRQIALRFETFSRLYLGPLVEDKLLEAQHSADAPTAMKLIVSSLVDAETSFIEFHYRDQRFKLEDRLEVFNLLNPTLTLVNANPELMELYRQSFPEEEVDTNSVKTQGGMFF
jgi:hypothetical protein